MVLMRSTFLGRYIMTRSYKMTQDLSARRGLWSNYISFLCSVFSWQLEMLRTFKFQEWIFRKQLTMEMRRLDIPSRCTHFHGSHAHRCVHILTLTSGEKYFIDLEIKAWRGFWFAQCHSISLRMMLRFKLKPLYCKFQPSFYPGWTTFFLLLL